MVILSGLQARNIRAKMNRTEKRKLFPQQQEQVNFANTLLQTEQFQAVRTDGDH
jgi:hypothetical protein